MSEAKFTKGPWVVEGNDLYGKDDGYTVHVAEIHMNDDDNHFSRENAHLIAAAPELYEALEVLFASYKSLADSGDAGFWKIEDQPEGKQALAALAKARGE